METQPKVLKWSLILGIVIVLNLFFNYTLSLVYDRPEYENFCPNRQVIEPVLTQEACLDLGGQWNANVYTDPVSGLKPVAGYCDTDFTCRQNYEEASRTYDRNVFMTLVILGALSVAAGSFFVGNMVISQALSLGGVLSFIIASMRYWGSADDAIRVLILAISLVILAWVAVKKFKGNA